MRSPQPQQSLRNGPHHFHYTVSLLKLRRFNTLILIFHFVSFCFCFASTIFMATNSSSSLYWVDFTTFRVVVATNRIVAVYSLAEMGASIWEILKGTTVLPLNESSIKNAQKNSTFPLSLQILANQCDLCRLLLLPKLLSLLMCTYLSTTTIVAKASTDAGMDIAAEYSQYALPFLRGWLDIGGNEKQMKMNGKALDAMMEKWLQQHKTRSKSSPESGDEQDFMVVVMMSILCGGNNSIGKLSKPRVDADTIRKSSSLALIIGGSDATMVNLVSAVSLLLNNQSKLQKAQEELDNQVGKEKQVQESDIKELPYLRSIIKETLHLYAVPLLPPRQSTEDCVVAGYFIPAGTRLILHNRKIQRDPLVWSNPLEFQLERFLPGGDKADLDVRGQNFELVPFSADRRMCPGVSFATQVMHLALARVIHGFDIKAPSDAPIDMTENIGFSNVKSTPLEVMLTPRLSSELYA